ncbi:hypothetical protein LCGT_1768 [Lactococcus garvieae ATCC 49156]|uniref:Uncharacterized protein n=1 Tax=Lactococcus garvieae (strain Lg2) TaxID=420890 RepID=F9VFZ8_LACGL|nr:hypothetical protein LCGT_1768 [Lactococcus garvieae ATCC 49156]BAK61249.1 hypothetical protein LCGL_1789 [Lactococcus garvieae Lg2]
MHFSLAPTKVFLFIFTQLFVCLFCLAFPSLKKLFLFQMLWLYKPLLFIISILC